MKLLILICLLAVSNNNARSAVYDTLPVGINTIVAREVGTTKIESKFGADKTSTGFKLKEEFTTQKLLNISDAINNYFKELELLSPDAYNQFSLGEFSANAWAEVHVQGYGYGRGITDHLTVLASIPVYHLKTNINFSQTKRSNLSYTKSTIANAPTNSAAGNFIRELTMQLPETSEELLQSLIVNFYGYKPLGHFERDSLGDAELGMIYRLTDFNDKGQAIAMGIVLPTGKVDDPDSLQDAGTGDGQYDLYLESLSGVSFFDKILQLDLKLKYTYQFASKKNLRMLTDPDFPLTKEKRNVHEKLGNKFDTSTSLTLNPNHWLSISSALVINKISSTQYNIPEENIKYAMEAKTDSYAEWAKVGIGFSTIELYKQKKFTIPCELNFSFQKILSAKNTPNFDRIDADFHFYF